MEYSPNHHISTRLRSLTWSCLDCDLIRSATFFAERYFCHDSSDHQARHLFATALLRGGQTHSAMNLVKDHSCLGCTELFARCCNVLGRFRQGQAALEQCMMTPGIFATTSKPRIVPCTCLPWAYCLTRPYPYCSIITGSTTPEPRQLPDAAVLLCRAGTLAMKGNLPDQAEANFRRALALNPLMWEAFEGLCQLGLLLLPLSFQNMPQRITISLGVFPHLDSIIPAQSSHDGQPSQSIPQPSFHPSSAFIPPEGPAHRRPWPHGRGGDAHETLFTPVSQPAASIIPAGNAPNRVEHLLGRPPPKFKLNRPLINGRDSM